MNIDFVIPWVDGSDPEWQQLVSGYATNGLADPSRYRDWELLKYWFRSVEAYAPWVHRIHFITCGQIPAWLNTDHLKLHLVDHKDYIPEEYLPTFSSHTIELNLHRIEDLAEHFVYFNDDMFLNGPISPEDFFQDGLPRDSAILEPFQPDIPGDVYMHTCCNVMAVINRHFSKKNVLSGSAAKWLSPLYGRDLLKNIWFWPTGHFSSFHQFHVPTAMLKSTFEEVWNQEPQILHNTCLHKFRSAADVNQYLIQYWNLCSGKFQPRRTDFGMCYGVERENATLIQDLKIHSHKVICANDHPGVNSFETAKAALVEAFEMAFPKKSSFER